MLDCSRGTFEMQNEVSSFLSCTPISCAVKAWLVVSCHAHNHDRALLGCTVKPRSASGLARVAAAVEKRRATGNAIALTPAEVNGTDVEVLAVEPPGTVGSPIRTGRLSTGGSGSGTGGVDSSGSSPVK